MCSAILGNFRDSLGLWVLRMAASYNVNKPPGTAGVFLQQSLNTLAGEPTIA